MHLTVPARGRESLQLLAPRPRCHDHQSQGESYRPKGRRKEVDHSMTPEASTVATCSPTSSWIEVDIGWPRHPGAVTAVAVIA